MGREPELHYCALHEIAGLIERREISPVDVVEALLARIETVDPTLKSYATVMADQALAAARDAEREISAGAYRGPLHGVPVALKDLCCTRGVRTMGGAAVWADYVPDFDAEVVTKLRRAGAVIIGKLNLTEGAMAGYHPDFDIPVNPWNAAYWSGVSSSGSGVAVAAGLCYGAIGTDTGGSIRLPASANGIVGFKPTYGAVSRHGVLPLSGSLDHVGPMTRSVLDAAIMFDAIAGYDPNDVSTYDGGAHATSRATASGAAGFRIGIDRDFAFGGIDPGQAASIEAALGVLAGQGAEIVDVRMPDITGVPEAWLDLCSSEAAANHKAHYPSRADVYGPYFREFLQMGTEITEAERAGAKRVRERFRGELAAVLRSVDAVACPAGGAPSYPLPHEVQYGSMSAYNAYMEELLHEFDPPRKRGMVFTRPIALAGNPAICQPSGFAPEGVPYSIQFVGRHRDETTLLRIAYAYERATDWHARRPPV